MAINFLSDQLFPSDIFLVDVSLGRIGVNTLVPRTALEVVGTIRVWSGSNTHTYVETSSGSNLGSIQGKQNSDNAVKALALNPLGGNIGINLGAGVLPTSKLEIALETSSGSDGIFVKGAFAGGSSFTASKNPFISLGTSTDSSYTSTIYLGSSATPTDQESKIEFNRSGSGVSRLSIYHKGQGTYREHLRFGNPSSSTATSVFFGDVGINETAPTQKLHVAGNARVTGAYYDSGNSPGTSGQVLSSTATGTDWVTPTTGDITGVTAGTALTGGGTSGNVTLNVSTAGVSGLSGANIPTSTANRNYVVQHQNTANQTLVVNVPWISGEGTITGVTAGTGMTGGGTSGTVTLNCTVPVISNNNQLTNGAGYSTATGTITGGAREDRIAFGSAIQDDITNDEDFTIVQTANEERIRIANGGVQVANMSAAATDELAGSLRYRYVPGTPKSFSFVDMCMQTGGSTFKWINIVQNVW